MTNKTVILLRKEVEHRTSLSRSSIYRMMDTGAFPRPIRLTPSRVGWKESDIQQWLEDRIKESEQAA